MRVLTIQVDDELHDRFLKAINERGYQINDLYYEFINWVLDEDPEFIAGDFPHADLILEQEKEEGNEGSTT